MYSYSSVFKVVWGLPNWTIQMHSRWSSFLLGKGAYKGSARSSSAADQVITGFRGLPAVPSDLAPPAALATRPGFPLLQFPAFFFFPQASIHLPCSGPAVLFFLLPHLMFRLSFFLILSLLPSCSPSFLFSFLLSFPSFSYLQGLVAVLPSLSEFWEGSTT